MWRSALVKPVRRRSVAPYLIVLAVMLIIPRAGGAVPDRRASTTGEFSTECQAEFNRLLQELAGTLSRSLSSPMTPLIGDPFGLDNLSMKRMRFTVDALLEPLLNRLPSFHKLGAETQLRVELNGAGAIFELLFPEGVNICAELTPQPGIQAMQNGNGLQPRELPQEDSSDNYDSSKEAVEGLGKGLKEGFKEEIDDLRRGLAGAAQEWIEYIDLADYFPRIPGLGGGGSGPSTPGGGSESSPFFQDFSFKARGVPWEDNFMAGFQCLVYEGDGVELTAEFLAGVGNDSERVTFKATQETGIGLVSLGVIHTNSGSAFTLGANFSF